MIRPHHLGEDSSFLGQTCALCKQEFGVGDEIVICPEDGSRHHTHCWQANHNHCTAYGCRGEGVVGVAAAAAPPPVVRPRPRPTPPPSATARPSRPRVRPIVSQPIPNAPGSKVRTLPAGSFGCVRGCFVVVLLLVLVLVALACAGAWFYTRRMEPTGSVRAVWPLLSALAGLVALRLPLWRPNTSP